MSEATKTAITGVRTVGVPVTDQDRALEFYVEKLGFEEAVRRSARAVRQTVDRGGARGRGNLNRARSRA
jgi:catechol 2,3-dioxygenase-like lactoylglutathione lyase family enzyme